MLTYLLENKGLTTETIFSVQAVKLGLKVLFVLSLLPATIYAKNASPGPVSPDLTPQDKSYIYSLQDNTDHIPAWLIAQLLHVSNSLSHKLQEPTGSFPLVELNELLADPARYRGRVVAIRALYAKSSNVNELLQLAPNEQAWSVLLIDALYHHAIQLFTSQDPSKFYKSQALYAVGVFLTTRMDRPEQGSETQSIVVPVIIGTLVPVSPELPPVKNNKIFNFLVLIILLIVIYIFVKIYLANYTNVKLSLREKIKKKDRNN